MKIKLPSYIAKAEQSRVILWMQFQVKERRPRNKETRSCDRRWRV